jgi:hypothetical protein
VKYDIVEDYCDGSCSDGIDVPIECECLNLLPPIEPAPWWVRLFLWYDRRLRP